MTLTPLGDSAVVISVGAMVDEATVGRVRAIAAAIETDPPAGIVEVVPAFASVTVYYDVTHVADFADFCKSIETRAAMAEIAQPGALGRIVEIPVCYGGEFGPDLDEVAERAGLSGREVIEMHSEPTYFVQAIGFLPGFGYLGGLPVRLHCPRRATPRTQVPAGAVGIGGALTGVYPVNSPGGWNLIGRTPLTMFDHGREEPALVRAGDRVRFTPIQKEDFSR